MLTHQIVTQFLAATTQSHTTHPDRAALYKLAARVDAQVEIESLAVQMAPSAGSLAATLAELRTGRDDALTELVQQLILLSCEGKR